MSAGPAETNLFRAPGSGAPVLSRSAAASPGLVQLTSDTVAALLQDLTATDLRRLIDIIEGFLSPPDTARPAELLRTAVSATETGDVREALGKLTEFVALDPLRIESLRTEPGLAPIRVEVDNLLYRLTSLAKLDAEGRLGRAAQIVDTGPKKLLDWDTGPEALLRIANRLVDAGGHENYVRAARLAQVLIDGCPLAPILINSQYTNLSIARMNAGESTVVAESAVRAVIRRTWISVRKRAPSGVRALWLRAPLLVLFLFWFALGLAGGTISLLLRSVWREQFPLGLVTAGFDLWGLGFLVLAVFGFYMRVRKLPR